MGLENQGEIRPPAVAGGEQTLKGRIEYNTIYFALISRIQAEQETHTQMVPTQEKEHGLMNAKGSSRVRNGDIGESSNRDAPDGRAMRVRVPANPSQSTTVHMPLLFVTLGVDTEGGGVKLVGSKSIIAEKLRPFLNVQRGFDPSSKLSFIAQDSNSKPSKSSCNLARTRTHSKCFFFFFSSERSPWPPTLSEPPQPS
eukprot:RCo051841